MKALRVLATIVAGPMLVVGCIWVLQGLNVLPGSFMTGQIIWAVYGVPLAVAGGALVWWVNRKRARSNPVTAPFPAICVW